MAEYNGTGVPRPTRPISVEADTNAPPSEKGNKTNTMAACPTSSSSSSTTFLRKAQSSWRDCNTPTSTQLIGFLTLVASGTILIVFTGLTITMAILTLVFFAPLLIISSPIWIPVGTILFVLVSSFLTLCGFFVAFVAGLAWTYRYFRGMNPPGSDQVDYARTRLYHTATHVKDCAKEYSGYLQSGNAKDAAPGA
ncbi:unnamed protein product [Linum perenne]